MKFLIDQCLSADVAEGLRAAGHDALHTATCGLHRADDTAILAWAASQDRIIVSADTDFGALLAAQRAKKPSAILYRRRTRRRPHEQLLILLANLPAVEKDLEAGAIVVIEDHNLRVRNLPIGT